MRNELNGEMVVCSSRVERNYQLENGDMVTSYHIVETAPIDSVSYHVAPELQEAAYKLETRIEEDYKIIEDCRLTGAPYNRVRDEWSAYIDIFGEMFGINYIDTRYAF